MSDIKPIETRYNGYKFRSRLEARWAVFFDAAYIKYDYELEGYAITKDLLYLPDFFLPEIGLHVEVKPNFDFLKDAIFAEKIIRFGVDEDKPLLIVTGTPGSHSMALLSRQNMDPWSALANEGPDMVEAILYEMLSTYGKVHFGSIPMAINSPTMGRGLHLLYSCPECRDFELPHAMRQAREARFEHGRSGN